MEHSHQCLLHRPHHHYHHQHLLIFHSPLSPHPPHHHCHHHQHHHCHHHHYIINPPPQISQPEVPLPPPSNLNHNHTPHTTLVTEYVAEVEDEGEDDDPVFVMTDEWKEFFAKSEAKRREAKKLAKKQGKK